jgi:hypothetical protein
MIGHWLLLLLLLLLLSGALGVKSVGWWVVVRSHIVVVKVRLSLLLLLLLGPARLRSVRGGQGTCALRSLV